MAEKVILNVEQGKVRGIKKKSAFSKAEYYSFFGIPYGQNTSGASRFKDPLPVKPWKNILDASIENKKGCAQFSVQFQTTLGSEDCLYNNIHTPMIPSRGDPLKAVIIDIHPGGFYQGTPETWYYGSPNFVMHRDIVYVCIAYRLHILGFLNLGLEQCSGNQALKDIILSLKWIRDNIAVFGGDPNNVTLLGNSSGSFLVHYLLLSPKAEGLFHKVVMMGGDVFNPVTVTLEENASLTGEIAQDLGYKNDVKDKAKLLAFFKRIPIENFVKMRPDRSINQVKGSPFPASPFKPTVDQGENAVLPQPCRKLINSMNKVPILFGICEKEALLGFCKGIRNAMEKHLITALRNSCLSWGHDITDAEAEFIENRVQDFYFEGRSLKTAPLSLLIDIETDLVFSDVYRTLLNPVSKDLPSSVFIYKFTFKGNACNIKRFFLQLVGENVEGTIHSEDFSYWSHVTNRWGKDEEKFTPETVDMIHRFTKIISTFAKTGDPNHKELSVCWNPSTIENPCYMKIDKEMELVDGKLNGKRMEFWENVKKELKRDQLS